MVVDANDRSNERFPRLSGPSAIAARLEAAARQAAEDSSSTRSLPVARGFELDTTAHELRHDGTPVHLRPREFQLLATLAANPGRAMTRDQMMDLAWGLDGESEQGPSMSCPLAAVQDRGAAGAADPPGHGPWLRLPPGPARRVNRPLTCDKRSVDGGPRR